MWGCAHDRNRGHLRADSKSEQVVLRRLKGEGYKTIAADLGTTVNSCRVLMHKRRRLASRLLASKPEMEWPESVSVEA